MTFDEFLKLVVFAFVMWLIFGPIIIGNIKRDSRGYLILSVKVNFDDRNAPLLIFIGGPFCWGCVLYNGLKVWYDKR